MFPSFYTTFLAVPGITAILGSAPMRFYRRSFVPQVPDAGIYATESTPDSIPENNLSGTPTDNRARHTITIWGRNDGTGNLDVDALALLMLATIEPHHHVDTIREGSDRETRRYRVDIDVIVWQPRTS
jgi:hypothetical protein